MAAFLPTISRNGVVTQYQTCNYTVTQKNCQNCFGTTMSNFHQHW